MRVLPGKRYNPAKPLLFGKSGYNLVKGILLGESEKLLKYSFAHVILIEINRERNQFKMPDYNYTYFLDLETGESVFLADELITGLDNEGLEEFIWTLKGEKADKLEYAIRGRGVFRRFKDMADRMGILSSMIFRQNMTGNWQPSGAGSRDWSMRRRACED